MITPLVDFGGSGYVQPPEVKFEGGSLFDTHFSKTVTTIYDYQNHFRNQPPYGPNGTVITRPFAKSLLFDTSVSQVFVRPTKCFQNGVVSPLLEEQGRTVISPTVSIKERAIGKIIRNHRQRRPLMWMAWEPSTSPLLGAAILKSPKSWSLERGRGKRNCNHAGPHEWRRFSGALKNSILPIGYPSDGAAIATPWPLLIRVTDSTPIQLWPLPCIRTTPSPIIFDANESLFGSGPQANFGF